MSRPYHKRAPGEPVTRWLPYGGVTWVRHYPRATGVIVSKNAGTLFAWTVTRTTGYVSDTCHDIHQAKAAADEEARRGAEV